MAQAPPVVASRKPRRFLRRLKLTLLLAPVVLALLLAAYIWIALRVSYANGERAGYVQKFSRKGWICKTWEGELAMATLPGTLPQVFQFTVRDDGVAARINENIGQRVALSYEQHRGLPTNCFGETEYFVVGAKRVEP
jgi:hypothetical protein